MNKAITLTVNGEDHRVFVTDRSQLVEVLRDQLDLTGTHVGCEQGVCGACTVLVDGKPTRSCIAFAGAMDGAQIETIEGFIDDEIMGKIRDAFSRHHGLQCGFCTPGMLTTSYDILTRFHLPSEVTIRRELSGNLCRCTGYQGIVQAIADVAEQLDREGFEPIGVNAVQMANSATFESFEPKFAPLEGSTPERSKGSVHKEGNWTVIERSIVLPHSRDSVWELFSDVEQVAQCVPGASLSDLEDNKFNGEVAVAFGPIKARFGGTGEFTIDQTEQSGFLLGQGADKGSQSNVKGELRYALSSGEHDNSTDVSIKFRFQIQGMLAQFNRPELVTGFVDFLLEKFISNCNSVLSGGEASASHNIGAFSLGWAIVKSFFRRHR